MELTKFAYYIDIDKIYKFAKINKTVMALDLCQNFVSAQYLNNKLMGFDQILHIH